MSAIDNKQSTEQAFSLLLGELGEMKKALPAAEDDNKIKAAAEDGEEPKLDADGKPVAAPVMAKSMKVTLEDGTEIEAEDGTELVKSLMARLDNTEGDMVKAFTGTIDLVKGLAAQVTSLTTLSKSLQAKVTELSGEGRGRKTMVSVHEKLVSTDLVKSEPAGMGVEEFMTKANVAFEKKAITGLDLTVIDVARRTGNAVDPSLVAKVMASAT